MNKETIVSIMLLCGMPVFSFAEEPKLLPPGTAAPSFSLPTINGERVSLSVYCGQTLSKPYTNKIRQTVILSFWATYCKPCKKELPLLAAFSEKHKNDNVQVFCISIDKEGESAVGPYLKENNLNVQALVDPYMRTSKRYGVSSLPSLFLVDTMGIIRYASHGYNDKENFEEKLEKILSEVKGGTLNEKTVEDAGGEQVSVRTDAPVSPQSKATAPEAPSTTKGPTPHQKWNAVMKVECGEPIDKVASESGVTAADIKKWHEELKNAAIKLWPEN